MPDRKITDLTVATTPLQLTDILPIVDVSDTEQSGAGSTRKITLQTLLQALSLVGTAMSDPIDTDVLQYFDAAAPTTPKTITLAELRHILTATSALTNASAADRLRWGARLKGRPVLAARNHVGRDFAFQPADYSIYSAFIGPSATTVLTSIGCALTSVGTISHPTPTQLTGLMSNHVTAGTANATAGTSDSVAKFFRGDGSGAAAGYYFAGRIYMPDASYDQTAATTGSRIFAGLTSNTLAAQVASDNPAGDFSGFARNHTDAGLQHTNWQIATKDGTTINFTDTGVPFTVQNVYELSLWQPIAGGTLYWTIENITTGSVTHGTVSTNLPTATVAMRFGMQVQSVNAVARNIREQHLYCESDV